MTENSEKITISTRISKKLATEINLKGIKYWECVETGARVLLGSYQPYNTKFEMENMKLSITKMKNDLLRFHIQIIAINKVLTEISGRDALKENYEHNYQK